MKFLETITFLGDDALIPINRIKFIILSYKEGYEIKIVSDDGDWIECFKKDEKKAHKRYEMIKEIIEDK